MYHVFATITRCGCDLVFAFVHVHARAVLHEQYVHQIILVTDQTFTERFYIFYRDFKPLKPGIFYNRQQWYFMQRFSVCVLEV